VSKPIARTLAPSYVLASMYHYSVEEAGSSYLGILVKNTKISHEWTPRHSYQPNHQIVLSNILLQGRLTQRGIRCVLPIWKIVPWCRS